MTPQDVTPDEQRTALRRALSYRPIAESQTLARFLEFVGEKAIEDQSQHVKEYVIATEVFHKSREFDPRMDPIVRVHARRLRERLDDYYRATGARDPVRIQIPKGSYLPQFVRPKSDAWRLPASVWRWVALALALVAVAETALLIRSPSGGPDRQAQPSGPASPLLEALLGSSHATTIAFSNDLLLKDKDGNMFRLKAEEKLDLLNRIQTNPRDLLFSPSLANAGPFYLDTDYTGTGEAVCIFLLTRYFAQRGRDLQVRASSLVNPQELRDRNVIFLGSPRENIILSKTITVLDFRFVRQVNPAGRPFLAIENARPRPGEAALYEARLNPASGNPQEVYGLISVLPGLDQDSRFIVVAGESTAGTQGACEFLAHPRLEGNPLAAWKDPRRVPAAYQILLKTAVQDFAPTRTEYVTHHEKNR